MEHGLKEMAFYVQKHITPCTVVITSLLVRDKPLGAAASVKRAYSETGFPQGLKKTLKMKFSGKIMESYGTSKEMSEIMETSLNFENVTPINHDSVTLTSVIDINKRFNGRICDADCFM